MKKVEKIRELVVGKTTKGENILVTKQQKIEIKKLVDAAKYWDSFNVDLLLQIKKYNNEH
mgnify:CR=1 FL=1|jgi:hypothetical protein|tara:strand:- start:2838 stop:3017 length:180 start_codon:yes stop_codon:yes gene_type:complete